MQSLEPTEEFLAAAATAGIDLTDAQLRRLGRYLFLLLETNKQFNLTAIREPGPAWMRHILESIAVAPVIDETEKTVIDVGSGGGLPGVPLAIMRPDLRVTLLESTGKKARFLGTVRADLGLTNMPVVTDRAETIAMQKEHRERYDIAIARAVGPMNVLLELTLPFIKLGGRLLALKGAAAGDELRNAGDALMILGAGDVHAYELLPNLDDDATIVEIIKDRPTPDDYPRRPGIPKQEPL